MYLPDQSTCPVHCSLLAEKGLVRHQQEVCAYTRAKQSTVRLQDEAGDQLMVICSEGTESCK